MESGHSGLSWGLRSSRPAHRAGSWNNEWETGAEDWPAGIKQLRQGQCWQGGEGNPWEKVASQTSICELFGGGGSGRTGAQETGGSLPGGCLQFSLWPGMKKQRAHDFSGFLSAGPHLAGSLSFSVTPRLS